MADHSVWTFFYGSYMNLNVLREVDILPDEWTTCSLANYELIIQPRANVLPCANSTVYGIVAKTDHTDLERLYTHAREVLGETYLPEAVLITTKNDASLPALCYISHDMKPAPAANDYVDRILQPSREYGFPEWYLKRIESFRRG